jgi:hypothetical protein
MAQPSKAGSTLRPQPVTVAPDDWPVQVQLAGGRRVRATFEPRLARRDDLAAVARVSAANDRRSFAALQRQRVEIRALRRSQEELSQRVKELQERSDEVVAGLLDRMSGLERSAETAVTQGQKLLAESRTARALVTGQAQELRSMAIKAGLDKVTAAVNTAQAAAFGQRGSLLATNNLVLLANQLFWTFLDPVLRGLGIQTGPSPGLVDFVAPLGALAAGQAALSGGQHQRFVTGVTAFDGTTLVVSESLRDRVADSFFPKLRERTDVPVTLSPLDPSRATFTARVSDGTLTITAAVPPPPPPPPPPGSGSIAFALLAPEGPRVVRVAWIVDLGADIG